MSCERIKNSSTFTMQKIVTEESSHWLAEDCSDLAREGLRTLVFGQKILSENDWLEFKQAYASAQEDIIDRAGRVAATIESLEHGLELISLSEVEDKLQDKVPLTLEMLRKAGIKVWMLTGDKRETATCIATSSRLAARTDSFCQMELTADMDPAQIQSRLSNFRLEANSCVLVIDGGSLQILLDSHREAFFEAARHVVCCRCSPTQKAEVVKMIRLLSGLQTAAIGDGGNDVSMIQAANIDVGIVGKEGRQASLAADYSVIQFSHISKLLLWHGRNTYLNTAAMSQIIIHRGCIVAFMQWIFSCIFYMSPVVMITSSLLLGYSMWYTMFPVFVICMNEDVTEQAAMTYPELYEEPRAVRFLEL